ncbi:MAG: hypothetical protein IPJ19_16090 [Planctomycetes bacterium]|nr:hypothetical protein [Planctomycetota bacterium]
MNEARAELAESFLAEAVFRSRERQAAGVELRRGAKPLAGTCGLGEKAAVELDLSSRGRELAGALWPEGLEDARLERVRAALAEWIVEQDALDRRRNHFLRDFRGKHGFDRTQYTSEVTRAFEEGLALINAQETQRRREVAQSIAG